MRCREEQRFAASPKSSSQPFGIAAPPEATSKLTLVESASLKLNTHEEAGVCIPKTKTDEISWAGQERGHCRPGFTSVYRNSSKTLLWRPLWTRITLDAELRMFEKRRHYRCGKHWQENMKNGSDRRASSWSTPKPNVALRIPPPEKQTAVLPAWWRRAIRMSWNLCSSLACSCSAAWPAFSWKAITLRIGLWV